MTTARAHLSGAREEANHLHKSKDAACNLTGRSTGCTYWSLSYLADEAHRIGRQQHHAMHFKFSNPVVDYISLHLLARQL